MRLFLLLILSALSLGAVGCGRGAKAQPRALEEAKARDDQPSVREQGENPLYASWSKFKPGTAIVQRSVTQATGTEGKTTTTTTYKLLELSDQQAIVEMKATTKRYDGAVFDTPAEKFTNARWISLPPGVKKEEFGKPQGTVEQGEETVRVADRDYNTRWFKGKDRNEAGEVFVTTWTCDEVPGGLIKSITRIPAIGKTTTIEVVEIRSP